MLNFQKKKNNSNGTANMNPKKAVDMRQRLLQKEFENLKQLPVGCSMHFDDPDILYSFKLEVVPDKDSLWNGGKFVFLITVPEG
jgi:ubiquitin-protein ligase